MSAYAPPIRDMIFALTELAGLSEVRDLPGCEEMTPDLVVAVLAEAGRFGSEVLAPLNASGDREGCALENGAVRTPRGFPQAYRQFVDGGWNSVAFDPEHGGQGLPWAVSTAVAEIWHSSNMAFALCPMLTQGAIELLQTHGSPEQKARYLPRMVSGEWTGTMNLTEPQAGSDLAAVRTRAVREGDHYRVTGQKIFITHGDHDFTDNIVHMVLARTPEAGNGVRGLSLFIVPKFLVGDDGRIGARNDLRCIKLEHKLGIHASPTAVMAFGDDGGAIGYLVGEEGRGLECMFTMMNNARLAVGLQGVAIAERAYQQARDYARERLQGRAPGRSDAESVAIIHHPDVRRMLLTMKTKTEAIRALAYFAAGSIDVARRHPDPAIRRERQTLVDLLIPVVKAWSTDVGIEIASMGIQVHGGMGYIEETGAAQHLRDARITAIYEGTNGIQANDLVGRKVLRDGGAAARKLIAAMRSTEGLLAHQNANLTAVRTRLGAGVDALDTATNWLVERGPGTETAAAAYPYLRLFGTVAGGWLMAKAALAADTLLAAADPTDERMLETKLVTARFYADNVLPHASALLAAVTSGGEMVTAMDEAEF